MTERIDIERKVLSENDRLAAILREEFNRHRVVTLNLVSSPGSGKTSLLEKTLAALNDTLRIALIAGDVQTDNDARRLSTAGGRVVRPIVTGGACHLDARMITNVLNEIDLEGLDLLFIENVGNLVCPSSYDLGEDMKVVLISVAEGDDKPLKYPGMFRRSMAMIINKIDLLPYCEFDIERVKANAEAINGQLTILETSCRTNQGLESWFYLLKQLIQAKKQKR